MAELLTPDLCVIGAGAGGLDVAAAAAAFGVPVVLVEKAKMGGGCLNTGSVPSKALIAAARHARRIGAAAGLRRDRADYGDRFRQGARARPSVMAAIAPNDSAASASPASACA